MTKEAGVLRARAWLPRPPVLLYHGFGSRSFSEDPFGLFMPIDRFEAQLRLLKRYFHALDLSGYIDGLRRQRWPARSFLLTIDDGYVSTLEAAALLARYGIPAVLFVPPALLGRASGWMPAMPDERLLTPEQLVTLSRLGIEVGVHGMDHTRLTGLANAQMQTQIFEARERLRDVVGYVPRSFAYPEGLFDEQTVAAIRAAGYDVAFSVCRGGAGPLVVKRRGVNRSDSPISFLARLMPGYECARWLSGRYPAVRRVTRLPPPPPAPDPQSAASLEPPAAPLNP